MTDDQAVPVDPYSAIGELYDLEHDAFHDDVDLPLQLAVATGGPILELGCGSGRLLAPLAEAGFDVTGLDTSAPMLERARRRLDAAVASGQVTLFQGDMARPELAPGGPFAMVLYSLNALMHLETPERQLQSLRGARGVLLPQGQVVIDVTNPTPDYLVSLSAAPVLEGSWSLPGGEIVDKWAFRRIDPVGQVIETTLWYDLQQPNGDLGRVRTAFNLRYVHLHELQLMLAEAGFSWTHAAGSYELDPLDGESDRMLVTAGLASLDDPDTR